MELKFDFNQITGKVRAMHAVGQPPRLGISSDHMHYLTDAHIPYSRLHDVAGAFGRQSVRRYTEHIPRLFG